jgi:hypothetical protein
MMLDAIKILIATARNFATTAMNRARSHAPRMHHEREPNHAEPTEAPRGPAQATRVEAPSDRGGA